jgi:hypothetical protein
MNLYVDPSIRFVSNEPFTPDRAMELRARLVRIAIVNDCKIMETGVRTLLAEGKADFGVDRIHATLFIELLRALADSVEAAAKESSNDDPQ